MTTSGQSNGTMTVGDFVTAAFREAGIVAANENPSGEELNNAIRVTNWMLKSFMARGVNLWREEAVSLTVNAAATPLDQSIEAVQAVYALVGGISRPLLRYERSQYQMLPNKATPGQPSIYFADRQRDSVILYLWPVPSSASLTLEVSRVFDDVTAPDQTLDLPQKWIETGYVALAARLCSPGGVTRTDPATAASLAQRAAAMEQLMLNDDRPASLYMGARR